MEARQQIPPGRNSAGRTIRRHVQVSVRADREAWWARKAEEMEEMMQKVLEASAGCSAWFVRLVLGSLLSAKLSGTKMALWYPAIQLANGYSHPGILQQKGGL
ncbi:hypothetical protein CRM22_011358 [Opisthorchis felineus]|uniref:Uncharacterized protein n=1 Tax=Opisthorchis felineus TaxID=147828 RepID=A0A4S2JNV4_OPIFE|nr:hypothetical protein CRM22_011358 [Opisthorchis felineus]